MSSDRDVRSVRSDCVDLVSGANQNDLFGASGEDEGDWASSSLEFMGSTDQDVFREGDGVDIGVGKGELAGWVIRKSSEIIDRLLEDGSKKGKSPKPFIDDMSWPMFSRW